MLPALVAGLALASGGASLNSAWAQSARTGAGEGDLAVFKKACSGCHKWHGGGGGGYGGEALSLRKTQLDKEQVAEVVRCGRPGTGMPYHLRGAYDSVKCYDSLKADMGSSMPPETAVFLRPAEIDAVATYVTTQLKGKGDPTIGECTAFFGATSRACDIYRKKEGSDAPAVSH
ncbi:cytochrome c [Methylobacterium sp. 17Sr1-1]|uniref:c-type cytochrome n=1 Tax=Methylobacterium sp. 17Sr1-1 TaxID=2202826 RepID=UPI0032AF6B11